MHIQSGETAIPWKNILDLHAPDHSRLVNAVKSALRADALKFHRDTELTDSLSRREKEHPRDIAFKF